MESALESAVWADRLRLLGNGVVPGQAEAAFRFLYERIVRSTPVDFLQDSQRPVMGEPDRDKDEKMANAKRKAILRKMSKAKASGVGNNFRDGKYRLAVKKMMMETTSKDKEQFRVIFTVMNAIKIPIVRPPGPQYAEKLDIEPNFVGSDVDWLAVNLDDSEQPGAGNVKKLQKEMFNVPEIDDDTYLETLYEMCDLEPEFLEDGVTENPKGGEPLEMPQNPCVGRVIDMETQRIETKKNKKEIVVTKWSHVKQTDAEIKVVALWLTQVAAATAQQAQPAATA